MNKDTSKIPKGMYCYTIRETPCKKNNYKMQINCCPYWESKEGYPSQMDGYCNYLETGDMVEDGTLLLFDQVKCCDINEED